MKSKLNLISVRFSMVLIAMIVSFSVIIMSYNFHRSTQNIYSFLYKITDSITDNIIEKTNYYLNKTNTHIKVLANNNEINNVLYSKDKNVEIMKQYVYSEEHIASVYLADTAGNFLQLRRNPKLAVRTIETIDDKRVEFFEYKDPEFKTYSYESFTSKYNPTVRHWYKYVEKEKIRISDPYIYALDKKLGLTISYPKYNKYNEKILVAGIDITLESLSKFLQNEAKKINASVALVDNSNRIIASSLKNKGFIDIAKTQHKSEIIHASKKYLEGSQNGKVLGLNDESFAFVGKTFKIDDTKSWHIILTIPEKTIIQDLEKTLFETILISAVIILIFIFIAILISKKLTKPIIQISKDMEELHQLNLDVNIKADSNIVEINQAQNSLVSLRSGIRSFTKYMPVDLVRILIKTNQEAIIGGVEKDLAIMFTDIESFTTISETMSPAELTSQLSEYFNEMSNIIGQSQGTVDKYIGDAIMAFWGAPLEIDNPIERAVSTAILMQEKLSLMNSKWASEGKAQFKTRIGVHYGQTLVGNIGGDERMNYTIIGDCVNVASRLEGINKKYGTNIMVSEEVYHLVNDKFDMRYVDDIELKGKTSKTKIYTLNK